MSRSVFIAVTLVVFICYTGYTSAAETWPFCRTYREPPVYEYRCFGISGLSKLSDALKRTTSITIQSAVITNIPVNAFYNFRNTLKSLDIHSSGVQTIDSKAFDGVSQLRNLTLWGNKLSLVQEAWFANLNQLRTLDLSFNQISYIEERVFEKIPYLENLYIDSNNLQAMNWNGFSYLGNLKRAKIGKNPWHWWYRAQITRQLDNQHVDYSSEWDNYDYINHIVWTCMEKHRATESDDTVLDCASSYLIQEHSETVTDVQKATTNCGSQSKALYTCAMKPYPSQNASAITPKIAVRRILQSFIGTFKSMRNADAILAYRW